MLRMPRGSLAQRQLATGQLARGDQVCDRDMVIANFHVVVGEASSNG